ncbi:DMT family transporter [Pelagibius sp. CAU 1746]|uniref:DMT family transporter n=1 Tax=Pelagibius sp. CAU 1746 TaxID=3140370 RepID=UPI00325BBB0A
MHDDNRRGALLLALAGLVFTGEVSVVRLLGDAASDGQIVFARAGVQLLAVAVWILLRNPQLVKTGRPGLHLARGITSLICWYFYYRSFQVLDLALATTLTFTTSLFVVALAGPILKEQVGARRWILTMVGFGGVALASGIADVGTSVFNVGIVYSLIAALAAAVLVFQNRVLARTEATPTIMFYIGLVTTAGALPGLIEAWHPLAPAALGMLALSGGLGTLGMVLTVEAYRVGEVSALAPFPYLRLVFSLAAGILLFGEYPTFGVLCGAVVIAGCALAVRSGEPRRRGLSSPMR